MPLASAALLLALASQGSLPTPRYSSLLTGTNVAWRDFLYHFWDPDAAIPRLRPTDRSGTPRNDAPFPTFWHMAGANNVLFWRWKLTGSEPVREMIRSQWREVRARYSDENLGSAAWKGYRPDGIVNVSDDAAWAIAYLCQVHEATGDPVAIRLAERLIDSTYATFADPAKGGAGILYALPGQDPEHQSRSSAYEATIARYALSTFEATGHGHLLKLAQGSWEWMQTYLKHPAGVYFAELDLRPTVNAAPNPGYRKGIGYERPKDIGRGGSIAYIGGTMGMASLSAALYRTTGEPKYLEETRSICVAMLRPDTFLRPGGVLLNDRDGWSDGFMAPHMVEDALSLEGADPKGELRAAIAATALAIVKARTPDGFYGADWSGPEWDPAHRWRTWIEQARGGDASSSGAGMALPNQLPTTSSSTAMILAGAMVERARFGR